MGETKVSGGIVKRGETDSSHSQELRFGKDENSDFQQLWNYGNEHNEDVGTGLALYDRKEKTIARLKIEMDQIVMSMLSGGTGPSGPRSLVRTPEGLVGKVDYLRQHIRKHEEKFAVLVETALQAKSDTKTMELPVRTLTWAKLQLSLEILRSTETPFQEITEQELLDSLIFPNSFKLPAAAHSRPKRDRKKEAGSARAKKARKVHAIVTARPTRVMSAEAIKMAQVMILFGLPASPTDIREIKRATQLGDGSTVTVRFNATSSAKMPFGKDVEFIHWLFDRAIAADSSHISVRTATEFLIETGRGTGGKDLEELRQRLLRIRGLVITVERKGVATSETKTGAVVGSSSLPNSLEEYLKKEDSSEQQLSLPGSWDSPKTGIKLGEDLFLDIKKHHVAIPRDVWLTLQDGGSPIEQQIVLFLYHRCYGARSESVIPWRVFDEQYSSPEETNPRRMKERVKKAVTLLKALWPEVRAEIIGAGVLVSRTETLFLPDDHDMKRVRRLKD